MTTPNYEFEARLFRTAHEQLQAEIVHLKAALKKHGRHTRKCFSEMAFGGECICGFEDALKIK